MKYKYTIYQDSDLPKFIKRKIEVISRYHAVLSFINCAWVNNSIGSFQAYILKNALCEVDAGNDDKRETDISG